MKTPKVLVNIAAETVFTANDGVLPREIYSSVSSGVTVCSEQSFATRVTQRERIRSSVAEGLTASQLFRQMSPVCQRPSFAHHFRPQTM
jgi:hypothetical protein